MKKIYRFLIVAVLLLSTLTSKAQNDGITLTLLPHLSYNNFYNPGIPNESKFVFGLGISNIGFSVYNSSIKYNNLFTFENKVPTILDANKFINSLDEHDNFINTNISFDIFRLGLKFGKLFIDVDWRFRYNGEIHYSKDFLGFFVNGNGHYLGYDNPANFSIGTDINIYSEISAGFQYDINDKLTIGIRPKLMSGIANISVNDDETYIYTDEHTYEMVGDFNINIKAATVLDADIHRISELGDYFSSSDFSTGDILNFKENLGWGIDLGASYTFNKHFGVALGVYDLGFITWKNAKEKHVHKDKVVISDALINDFDNLMNMNIQVDDLYKHLLESVWEDDSLYVGENYKTALKTRIMLQGYYELIPMARFTAIAQMYYVKEKLRPALTLAYSGSFFKFLNFTTSYTISKYSGNSLGAGISVKLGPVSLYTVTDNIMIFSKLRASTVEMLTSYSSANIRFGLVVSLSR